MEEQFTVTRSEVLAIFTRWRKEASEGGWEGGTAEGDAETFIGYMHDVQTPNAG